jgi:hypothetical protein
MIKNFMFALWGSLFFISNVQAQQITTQPESEEHLLNDKIYFFAHSMCYSCKDAYIYFEQAHPELNIGITDMKYSHNLALYKECVRKFAIKNQELTLPLICMGDTYVMGWNKTSPAQFEQNLKSFQK